MLNGELTDLDKADMFALGATALELVSKKELATGKPQQRAFARPNACAALDPYEMLDS